MNAKEHQLFRLLEVTFNPEGNIHFLAISETQIQSSCEVHPIHQIRVALTYKTEDIITPYFDGTDLYVAIRSNGIQFVNENEWSDGPPIMEGSPIELALEWVSELAPPFWVSQEARTAAARGLGRPTRNHTVTVNDFDQTF